MAYTLIETVEVGSGGASSIEFTGIPQEAGADLVLLTSLKTSRTNTVEQVSLDFNGETATTNYSSLYLQGNGSSLTNATSTKVNEWATSSEIDPFSNSSTYISNYASTTTKSFSVDSVTENNANAAYQMINAKTWASTTGIVSLRIYPVTATDFLQYSTASLYLVTTADASGASTPVPKATGGSISLAGGYWYHTFNSSGTFTPTESLACDYLVVAGGGGGLQASGGSEPYGGGGGGAGGMLTGSVSLTANGHTATIGSGGGADVSGSDSSLTTDGATITSTGGGGATFNSARSGGSGSGGTYRNVNGASGILGQGNSGGTAVGSYGPAGGGGGGKGGSGGNGTAQGPGGAGGSGSNWNGTTYASGGAGGPANATVNGTAGPANTGNGGGGGGKVGATSAQGSAGGSGVVIVRYAA